MGRRIHVPDGRDHIGPGDQQGVEVVDVAPGIVTVDERRQRRVDDDVGAEVGDGGSIVGGGDADRVTAGELAGVAAGLVGRRDVHADELEFRSFDDRAQRRPTDVAGRPLDHAVDGSRHVDRGEAMSTGITRSVFSWYSAYGG